MAFERKIPGLNLGEEENYTKPGGLQYQPNGPRPSASGGAGAPQETTGNVLPSGSTSASRGAGVGAGPSVGTGFVSFGQRLSANQGAATNLATKTAQNVDKDAGVAAQGTTDFLNDFKGHNAQVRADNTLWNDPDGYRNNQKADLVAYDSGRYMDLTKSINKSGQQVAALQNDAGRQALLQEQNKGRPYSAGMARMDGALMGAADGNKFAQLQNKYGALTDSLDAANTAARADYDGAPEFVAPPSGFETSPGVQGDTRGVAVIGGLGERDLYQNPEIWDQIAALDVDGTMPVYERQRRRGDLVRQLALKPKDYSSSKNTESWANNGRDEIY